MPILLAKTKPGVFRMKEVYVTSDFLYKLEDFGIKTINYIGKYKIIDVYLNDSSHYLVIYEIHTVVSREKVGFKVVYKETLR